MQACAVCVERTGLSCRMNEVAHTILYLTVLSALN